MESIQQSINNLAQHFNDKMAEFQSNLQSAIPATSPLSNVTAQFNTFRGFVLSALEGLQAQIELLSKQYDDMENRSRRKILLVHGVAEKKNEDITTVSINVLSEHLQIPELTAASISLCHRMGKSTDRKHRAILIKFKDQSIRNNIWYAKTGLKNTGITLTEFLTKNRHKTFMTARQHFGISKCWTRNGTIVIIGPDGKRHNITSSVELNSIMSNSNNAEVGPANPSGIPSIASASATGSKAAKYIQSSQSSRSKRIPKK